MKIKKKKRLLIIGISVLVIACLIILLSIERSKSNIGGGGQIEITPLSQEQLNIVGYTILSSEFIGDLPSKGAVGLQFYDFRDGERIWQSGFLIGKDGFLNSGTPDLVLIMHAKYISYLDGTNLCEVIKTAQNNGEMWVETQEGNAKLLLKYAGMLKYRECFGF